jgi:glycosyltransferase involved in cell wall biosynthesis
MRLLFTDEIDVLFYWLHQWLIFLGFLNIFTMSEILLLISDRKFFVGICWRIFSVHIDMENDWRKGSYWLIAWIKIFAELFYVFRGSGECSFALAWGSLFYKHIFELVSNTFAEQEELQMRAVYKISKPNMLVKL